MDAIWHLVEAFFSASEWTAIHGVVMVLAAGVTLVCLVGGWPAQVKAMLLGAVTLVVLALMISVAGTNQDSVLGQADAGAAALEATAETAADRAFAPVRAAGRGVASAIGGVFDGITGMVAGLRP